MTDVVDDGVNGVGDAGDALSENKDHIPIESRRGGGAVAWHVVQILARKRRDCLNESAQEGLGVAPAQRVIARVLQLGLPIADRGRCNVLQIDEQTTVNLGLPVCFVNREFRDIGVKALFR